MSESLREALRQGRDVLAAGPAGVLTDFDGTLSPIVDNPADARLADGGAAALAALARRVAVVAIITGRAALDARRMTELPEVLIVGNHGTEWLEPRADAPTPSPAFDRVRRLLAEALHRLPELDGVTVEDKGLSATVHVRSAPVPDDAGAAVFAALDPPPPGVETREGRMSVELRPSQLGNKGDAARQVIDRHGLRGVVVLGDDVTDLDLFAAVAERRAAGRIRAAIVAVGRADEEVARSVIDAADVALADPAEAVELLRLLSESA